MASVNRVTLIGNCGRDPEIRYMTSGMAVCDISLATTSKRKDKNTGQTVEDTQWHRVKFFDKLAEIVGQYVHKGSPLYVEGRISYGKYTDQAGIEKNTCDIVADSMQLLGQRPEGGQAARQAPQQAPRQAPQQAPRTQQPQRQAQQPQSGFDDMSDDIPFRDPLAYRGHHLVM